MWNCTSGVASSGLVRAKMAPWPAPIVSGPVRYSSHSSPISSLCAEAVGAVVQGDRLAAAIDRADLEVILQVGADARQVVHHLDAVLLQMPGRADAGELQDLRRADRARRQHDLAAARGAPLGAVLAVAHADGAPAVEAPGRHQRLGLDVEVRPLLAGRR